MRLNPITSIEREYRFAEAVLWFTITRTAHLTLLKPC
jgi:hypothetical protein